MSDAKILGSFPLIDSMIKPLSFFFPSFEKENTSHLFLPAGVRRRSSFPFFADVAIEIIMTPHLFLLSPPRNSIGLEQKRDAFTPLLFTPFCDQPEV